MKFEYLAKCAQGLTIEANQPEAVVARVTEEIHRVASTGHCKAYLLIPEPAAHDLGVALVEAGYAVQENDFTTTTSMIGMIVRW